MGRKKMTSSEAPAAENTTAPVKFNKSARIRELFDAGRSAKEIKQNLDADGHATTINTIYTAIANYKKAKAGGGAKKTSAAPNAAAAPARPSGGSSIGGRFSLQDIQNISELAKAAGGYDTLIALLQAMKGS